MTPEKFAADFIFVWEDGQKTDPNKTHSLRRNDRGNWSGGAINAGSLIGSNHGVTPTALAAFRKVPVSAITYAVMHALTIEEAGLIALSSYYRDNHLDRLAWNAVTASAFDFGWGAGPITTVKHIQRLVGVKDDGIIGHGTSSAFDAWITRLGLEGTANAFGADRNAYYEAVIRSRPEQAENRNGWRNRTAYFLPGTPWWARFAS